MAEAVEVGDVPIVEVGVALARGGLGGLAAVALVAELDGAQAGGACKEGAVDAVEDGVVALGVAGVVDVGVAEVVVLGDVAAEGGAEVEGRLEDADVQAKAALAAGAEAGGGDGGAADGGVGEAGEEAPDPFWDVETWRVASRWGMTAAALEESKAWQAPLASSQSLQLMITANLR